jgi:Xaa-Pro aminopeptidase
MDKYISPFTPSKGEIERRYTNVRKAMQSAGLDYLIVSGSEYTGFEGAVRYMCGFHILHRYAYVVIPLAGDPVAVFPREATWVGDHSATFIEKREFPAHCGDWMADFLKDRGARKVGVYGLEYIMTVRDYAALQKAGFDLIDFDIPFDYARAQKSEEEIASVRHSMAINKAGVLAVLGAYKEGMTEARLMGIAEDIFAGAGTARKTMDMICTGPNGSIQPQMVFPTGRRVQDSDAMVYGLEIAGEGGHWVEFSRVLAPRGIDATTQEMFSAYQEFHDLAKEHMKAGNTAVDVHRACSKPFHDRGYRLGHVSGHSIGMTMIEMPRIGEGYDFVLPRTWSADASSHHDDDRTHCSTSRKLIVSARMGARPCPVCRLFYPWRNPSRT